MALRAVGPGDYPAQHGREAGLDRQTLALGAPSAPAPVRRGTIPVAQTFADRPVAASKQSSQQRSDRCQTAVLCIHDAKASQDQHGHGWSIEMGKVG